MVKFDIMRTLHDPLRLYISENLAQVIPDCPLSVPEIYHMLVDPPNPEMGDLAFGVFPLAKLLKKAPSVIATELISKLEFDPKELQVVAAGPYLNFTYASGVIGKKLLEPIQNGSFFKQKLTDQNPRMMVEYSQPNTHKELHVGHMRNACLGDSVIKVCRYVGQDVISSTFPGDVGTHVAKCLWFLKYHNAEAIPEINRGEWLGGIYSKAHLKLEDEIGTPQEIKNREQLTEILKQLENKSGEYFEKWKETRQWSIDLMKSVYRWAGIEFDHWYWESEMDSPSVQYVQELYKKNLLTKSEGAIGMDLSEDQMGFCMLLKTDGTGLYATKDLELARRKFQDYKIEKNVYVVDMRQALHFKQIFKVLEKLGFEQSKNCFHLQYNFVELPDGAMSSRKGNIVPLMKLVSSMETMVKDKYLSRYKGEWPSEEIDEVATQVAQGAIKYGMLKIDNNKKIVFDMNEWLKIDGESGPFIQYSVARINSLCKKLNYEQESVRWELLVHVAEKKLMQHLMQFHSVVILAAETYRVSILCTYLYELAKRFNLFYHECSVGQAETADLQRARLALSYSVGQVLSHGLGLLGIPAPERM